jgi:hypothetical protein
MFFVQGVTLQSKHGLRENPRPLWSSIWEKLYGSDDFLIRTNLHIIIIERKSSLPCLTPKRIHHPEFQYFGWLSHHCRRGGYIPLCT